MHRMFSIVRDGTKTTGVRDRDLNRNQENDSRDHERINSGTVGRRQLSKRGPRLWTRSFIQKLKMDGKKCLCVPLKRGLCVEIPERRSYGTGGGRSDLVPLPRILRVTIESNPRGLRLGFFPF